MAHGPGQPDGAARGDGSGGPTGRGTAQQGGAAHNGAGPRASGYARGREGMGWHILVVQTTGATLAM